MNSVALRVDNGEKDRMHCGKEAFYMEDLRYAVLIDSDNISAKYIRYILDEMTKYGAVTYKRIYGDWTSTQTSRWKNELLENSISPIQQFSNTTGKNATDSALIIDAMDILYTGNVDGFCIVSSDGDFTRLAGRLRESGMDVIGMGETKTPRSFRAACTVFTNLELLAAQEDENRKEKPASAKKKKTGKNQTVTEEFVLSKQDVEEAIAEIITGNENNGKETGLGEIGSRLVKKYSDFDVRTFGYSTLSKFIEEMERFETVKDHHNVFVRMKDTKQTREKLSAYVLDLIRTAGKNGMDLGFTGQKVHNAFPDFNVKEYGYATFSKFLQSIGSVRIDGNNIFYEEDSAS